MERDQYEIIRHHGSFRVRRESDGRVSRAVYSTEFAARMAAEADVVVGWVREGQCT